MCPYKIFPYEVVLWRVQSISFFSLAILTIGPQFSLLVQNVLAMIPVAIKLQILLAIRTLNKYQLHKLPKDP